MKFVISSLAILAFSGCAHSPSSQVLPRSVANSDANTETKLSSYTPYNYEVLFTEPVCKEYRYTAEVRSRSGNVLTAKPRNVYCDPKHDLETSGNRDSSPQKRLVDWINDPTTKEVFFTYLSFSNKAVKEALCQNAKSRGLKVNFVLDSGTEFKTADELIACEPSLIKFFKRGNVKGLGLAHNKIFIFNPQSEDAIRIVFSSGNMSIGPVLHHENWHFITTSVRSHFAQAHLCVMNAELSDEATASRRNYLTSIKDCRAKIEAPEESDIKAFFVPGEGEKGHDNRSGRKTAFEYLLNGDGVHPGLNQAKEVWLACHRFLHSGLMAALQGRMSDRNFQLRITADDDTYYDSNDRTFNHAGGTTRREWINIENLLKLGAEAKFMETNPGVKQLHHSKFIIFDDKAVLSGAANFTAAAYRTNMENIYYITVPEVVQKFRAYYQKQWTTMATAINDLPPKGNLNSVIEAQ